MIRVGIIVLNFNGNEDTKECLNSLATWLQDSTSYNFHIYLIDNNSNDPLTEKEVSEYALKLDYLKNPNNLGFAEGNNVGIRRACEDGCQYIMLLNNDTVLVDDSLTKTLDLLVEEKVVGVCGLVNYYFDNKEIIWQAGFRTNFRKGVNVPVNLQSKKDIKLCGADYVPGSSFIIDRRVIDKIGYLDSSCFAYYEDLDFCIRAKRADYFVGFNSKSKILHKVGKSSTSYLKEYLRTRNKLKLYSKYSAKAFFLFIYLDTLTNSILRILFKKGNKVSLFKGHFLAFLDFHRKKFDYGSLNKLI